MTTYEFTAIEHKWQANWQREHAFRTPNPGEPAFDARKPKFYVLDMFPYPSGVGLHVGHPLGYIATDIVARYKRMHGFNVLHPMGFDAFGLPAEQFAVEHGVHPAVTTQTNIDNMVRQLKRLGLSYDWSRMLSTTDPEYYKWTQWIFLQLFHSWFDPAQEKARPIAELERMLENEEMFVDINGELTPGGAEGLTAIEGAPIGARKWHELTQGEREAVLADQRLAYLAEVPVNWCPALGTVLANEEVTNEGRSERGNHPVYKRPLRQWMLRITAYAERLAADLDLVDWPEPIKMMQRNWIGRSEGAMVDFKIEDGNETIRVFTTRPDTLFGATYMVLAPEHPLVTSVLIENDDGLSASAREENERMSRDTIVTDDQRMAVRAYAKTAMSRTDIDRQAETKSKTGVFTGAYATNPANGERVPIWIADYVLMGYGTGAIMAVPAHDERDFEFAKALGLNIRPVAMPHKDWFLAYHPRNTTGKAIFADKWDPADREEVQRLNPDSLLLSQEDLDEAKALYLRDPSAFRRAFEWDDGVAINSMNEAVSLDGQSTPQAKRRMIEWLELSGNGRAQVQYKLRDWLFSRQRYWGEPFPILHGPNGEIRSVPAEQLPVALPPMEDFSPTASDDPNAPPRPPLARAPGSWRYVEIDGVRYERELNTMPQWAGSCWYYLRFCDPRNGERFVSREAEAYWMTPNGLDLYVGGAEHAVLHLLYSRFWHKVLHDLGHVSTPEPFGRLFNQGYIQAYAYQDARKIYVEATKVEQRNGGFSYNDQPVTRSLGKMGKSLKNAVSPDEMADQYGCDTLRLYEMYLGPLEQSKPWETRDIVGLHRFLQRVWRNFVAEDGGLRVNDEPADEQLRRLTHKTIQRLTEDMDRLAFNTAIAELIKLNNELVSRETLPRETAERFLLMLAPLAPHIAEELWQRLGHEKTIAYEPWPEAEQQYLIEDEIELPVQVNGKLRGRIRVPAAADNKTVEAAALTDEKVAPSVEGKQVRKVIVVPGKLVNIVVG